MKQLRELVQRYEGFMSDMQIVEEYLVQNDLEDEAVQMISRLLQRKNEKSQKAIDYARTWAPSLPDASQFVQDKEVARLLNKVQLLATLSIPLTSTPELLAKAREVIPTIDVPKMFFLPAVGYLQQYGICFKNSDNLSYIKDHHYTFAESK